MIPPRRIRPLTGSELRHLTVERLRAYRKQMLSLENSLAESDYADMTSALDPSGIYFKDDPRWRPLYDAVLDELHRKQKHRPAE